VRAAGAVVAGLLVTHEVVDRNHVVRLAHRPSWRPPG
jgi:hypothetical protein